MFPRIVERPSGKGPGERAGIDVHDLEIVVDDHGREDVACRNRSHDTQRPVVSYLLAAPKTIIPHAHALTSMRS